MKNDIRSFLLCFHYDKKEKIKYSSAHFNFVDTINIGGTVTYSVVIIMGIIHVLHVGNPNNFIPLLPYVLNALILLLCIAVYNTALLFLFQRKINVYSKEQFVQQFWFNLINPLVQFLFYNYCVIKAVIASLSLNKRIEKIWERLTTK